MASVHELWEMEDADASAFDWTLPSDGFGVRGTVTENARYI